MFFVDSGSSLAGLAGRWRRMLLNLSRRGVSRQPRPAGFRPAVDQLEGREAPGGLHFSDGFAGAAGLTLNGSAAIVGSRLQLTDGDFGEAASVFSNDKFSLNKIHTHFQFQLTAGTFPTADGITFTIQNSSPTALGLDGGDLGYAGIPNSVAIKWDLYDNAGEGVNSTGVFVNGEEPFVGGVTPVKGSTNFDGTGIDLHSEHVFDVKIAYNGKHHKLTVKTVDTATGATAKQTYFIDIQNVIGSTTAFVGFTGGTGGLAAVQDIVAWKYD